MSETLKKKHRFTWKKYVLLGLVLAVAARTILFLPRRGWSLKGEHLRSLRPAGLLQAGPFSKEIRNVVLISIDTLRADHLGCYGYSRRTSPNIDAFAAEGILFNHAVTPVPITLPAHSSMLTGTTPPYHKVRDNNNYRLSGSNVTLAEILGENGFVTGAIIGAFVLDSQFGLAQGFDNYDDSIKLKAKKAFWLSNERKAEEVTRLAKRWLEGHREERFFLFLHYFDPHDPYNLHKGFVFSSFPFLALRKDHYDSEIAYTDDCIGQVIEKMKELNLYDSTLVIITGDHGESLGQHSEKTHGYFTYNSSIHVPLIMRVPGGPGGVIIDNVAGLIDIVPTVCSAVGIDVPSHIEGADLSVFFSDRGGPVEERYLFSESLMPTKFGLGPLFSLSGDRWKYIHSTESELYDLREDPYEGANLFNKHTQQVSAMQERLKFMLEDERLDDIAGSQVAMDEETRKRLESLGYVAGRTVDEGVESGKKRLDPKKLVEVYNSFERIFPLIDKRKFSKAKRICHNLLKKWPDMEQVYFFLGHIALSENDTEGMVRYFSRFLAYAESGPEDSGSRVKMAHDCASAHTNLGAVLAREGKLQEAVAHYKKALSYNPYLLKTSHNLAGAYLMQGRVGEAVTYYSKTLDLEPNMPEANYMMGNILLKQGKPVDAITYYEKAIKSRPDWPEAQKRLKAARSNAISYWSESLRMNPNQPELHRNLGAVFYREGNLEKAFFHWETALQLKPDWPDVLNNVAWLKAAYENEQFYDADGAVQLGRRACELTGFKDPVSLDTLAVAYAASGNFPDAVQTAEEALKLAVSGGQAELASQIQSRLELYKGGQSYHAPAGSQSKHNP